MFHVPTRMLVQRRSRQQGNAFVETGLVFLVFFSMLVGTFDFGQFLFIHQALVERARNSVRWGAVNDPTNHSAIQNMVLYNQDTAPQGATQGYFGLTSSMVTVTDPGSGTDDYRLVVQISNYPYNILSPYISGTYSGPNIAVSYPIGQ